MTRSAANCSCDGATIDSPGGALFRRDSPGVFAAKPGWSLLGPSPLADCCCSLASIMWRCWSLTLMLRWSCSFMTGSCVTKPGDRQARPTSWMARPSRAVSGRLADEAPAFVLPPLDRSSFLGRWRGAGASGDRGSFLTTILGIPLELRDLKEGDDLVNCAVASRRYPRSADEKDDRNKRAADSTARRRATGATKSRRIYGPTRLVGRTWHQQGLGGSCFPSGTRGHSRSAARSGTQTRAPWSRTQGGRPVGWACRGVPVMEPWRWQHSWWMKSERKERETETVRGAGPKSCSKILALGQGRLPPVALGTVGRWVLAQGTRGPPCFSDLALSRPFPRRVRGDAIKPVAAANRP